MFWECSSNPQELVCGSCLNLLDSRKQNKTHQKPKPIRFGGVRGAGLGVGFLWSDGELGLLPKAQSCWERTEWGIPKEEKHQLHPATTDCKTPNVDYIEH